MPQPVKTGRKTMGYCHQVLHHLLLWAQRLRIHHHEFALMTATEMHKEIKTKAHQTVLMSKDNHSNLMGHNPIYQCQEAWTLEIQPSANLTDPLRHGKTPCSTEVLQYPALIRQGRFLCLTGDPHINHRGALSALPLWQHLIEMLVGIDTTIGWCPCGT